MRLGAAGVCVVLLGLIALSPAWWNSPKAGRTGEKQAALTFDDGPNPPYTEKFIELLRKHEVPGTFFLIGRNIDLHPATVDKLVQGGFELGNHSYSHSALAWKSPAAIFKEIADTDAAIRRHGYLRDIAFRAPFGQRIGVHAWVLAWLGRPNVLYSVAPYPTDYHRNAPEAIATSAIARAHPGAIFLLHDGEGIRIEALEAADRMIPRLKSEGYRFTTVSEVLSAK